ncbi:glycosyltransferase family 25 protein [Saccharicrinis sp. FJH54]|uniref:glycosyltransferase family 25 protein n=1 Tax=Saccharicrinis sp. FJH54 TaxID=3344665 RepID=UPI0035D51D6B
MQILIVNLEKDKERRQFVQQQLSQLNTPFNFITGVLGSSLSTKKLATNYNNRKALRHQCRPLGPSEIGCALSHINIYRKIANENISLACILEDDVIIPENFELILSQIEQFIDQSLPQVILLSPAKTKQKVLAKLNNKFTIGRYKSGYYTSSYILNNLAAKALLKVLYPVNDVADCWKRLHKHKIIDIYAINPPLIIQDQDSFGSSTTSDVEHLNTRPFFTVLKFKFCRLVTLSFDLVFSRYNRLFRPYANILKNR